MLIFGLKLAGALLIAAALLYLLRGSGPGGPPVQLG